MEHVRGKGRGKKYHYTEPIATIGQAGNEAVSAMSWLPSKMRFPLHAAKIYPSNPSAGVGRLYLTLPTSIHFYDLLNE